ncbi:redoxin domain-containing protein [Terrimonas alba]|uniref:redoxin domain-containing protein n=1 Tax=Terrimonas alba TaxID=3349636 RepID=UPI0036DEDC03
MLLKEGDFSWLKKANAWLNSPPLTASDLKGKVVLVEFGTYTCINWIRTLPYVRAWIEKYKEKGLVVIAVHTPEFPFEKSIDNIRRSINDMKIDFPIAIDNNYAIWEGFNNHYWPAFYFIDVKGNIRHHQFGEGEYEQSEKMIQQLLIESGAKGIGDDLVSINAQGVEVAADWINLNSSENYLGYERTENLTNNNPMYEKQHVYARPSHLRLNQWAVSGNWILKKKHITLNNTGGKIVYRFHARDVHLVMGPTVKGASVRFRVSIDGKIPGNSHGTDIDELGNGAITEQRLYQLIRQPNPISDREFEIEFFDSGVDVFAFTFG